MKNLRLGPSIVMVASFAVSLAYAQTTPPDPLQPGAAIAAEAAAGEPKSAPKKAAKRSAPRKREAGGALSVTIYNKRSVGLVELDLGPVGGEMKKVQGPLAFGRKSVVRVARVKDCLYDIKGHYADEADTDLTGVDLCKDKAINLTDE